MTCSHVLWLKLYPTSVMLQIGNGETSASEPYKTRVIEASQLR
jgi:hypothetical protein